VRDDLVGSHQRRGYGKAAGKKTTTKQAAVKRATTKQADVKTAAAAKAATRTR